MLSESNRWRMAYRCWRYRFKSEVPSIHFVRHAALNGKTLLDIGANRGIYSIYLSRAAGPDGRVIAFEPQPELEQHLNTVRRDFGLGNLRIVNVGLSSEPGTLSLRRPRAGSGAAGFHIGPSYDWEAVDVRVERLDTVLRELDVSRVDFIKCDVESHELDVFRGGVETLRRDQPALIVECNHEHAVRGELFRFLFDLGYDGHFFYVNRRDHRSFMHKNRGFYAHVSRFDELEYGRPSVDARNYLFLRRGLDPAAVHAGAGF